MTTRNLILILPFCWMMANGAFAQSGPLKTGYVIVTPLFGDFNNLSVSETFGFADDTITGQSSIMNPDLVTRAALAIPASALLRLDVGLALANPTDSDAIVTLTLTRSDGSFVPGGQSTITLPARRQRDDFVAQFFPNQSQLNSDFSGTLSIISSTGIGVMGLRFKGDTFSTLPLIDLSPLHPGVPMRPGGGGGPAASLFPQFAAGAGWATEFVVVNTGISSALVRVDVFGSDGNPLAVSLNGETGSAFPNLSIPPQGILVVSSADRGAF